MPLSTPLLDSAGTRWSLIVLFQEQIFNLFEKNINWRIIRIFGYFFDDSVKWSDDLFRILRKSKYGVKQDN